MKYDVYFNFNFVGFWDVGDYSFDCEIGGIKDCNMRIDVRKFKSLIV